LQISELTSQLKQSSHNFLHFILIQGSDYIDGSSISVLEEVQTATKFCVFLVVEKVDIFEVSIKREKEFCIEG
jgi:riboflavin synthase alpha subunit